MTTVSRTRRKLEEAQFFLEQLHRNYGKFKKFDFFLSAFISSARSVRWIMTAEYHEVTGWEDWALGRKLVPEEEELLKGFTLARNRIVKVEPLETLTAFTLKGITVQKEHVPRFVAAMKKLARAPASVSVSGDNEKGYVLEFELEGDKHVYPATEIDVDRRLQEFPDASALDVCDRYFKWLSGLVDECERKFGVP